MSAPPASPAVQLARERAAQLWRSPVICNRIADYLPQGSIAKFLAVDKVTFNMLVHKVYNKCTLSGYLRVARHGMIPLRRLNHYLSAARELDLTGELPMLQPLGDATLFFDIMPGLITLKWFSGTITKRVDAAGEWNYRAEVDWFDLNSVAPTWGPTPPPNASIAYRLKVNGLTAFCRTKECQEHLHFTRLRRRPLALGEVAQISINLFGCPLGDCLVRSLRDYKATYGHAVPRLHLDSVYLWDDSEAQTVNAMEHLEAIGTMGTRMTLNMLGVEAEEYSRDVLSLLQQDWSRIYRYMDGLHLKEGLTLLNEEASVYERESAVRLHIPDISVRTDGERLARKLEPLPPIHQPPYIAFDSTINHICLTIIFDESWVREDDRSNLEMYKWQGLASTNTYARLARIAHFLPSIGGPGCFYDVQIKLENDQQKGYFDAPIIQNTFSSILRGMVQRRIEEARPAPGWKRSAR